MSRNGLLHAVWSAFAIPGYFVVNEYGMAELSSQYYDSSLADRVAGRTRRAASRPALGPNARILDPDPRPAAAGRGRPALPYDLANAGSAHGDPVRGSRRAVADGFELRGRAPGAEARGCSLSAAAVGRRMTFPLPRPGAGVARVPTRPPLRGRARSPPSVRQPALAARARAEVSPPSPTWSTTGSRRPPRGWLVPSTFSPTRPDSRRRWSGRALPSMLEPLRAPALDDLVRREAGDRRGPPPSCTSCPGNLPGLAAFPGRCRSPWFDRPAQARPRRPLPALFLASLGARDPPGCPPGSTLRRGGDRACEDIALTAADLVVAAGDDATIADLAGRTRGRFIGHGHRISFAVVTARRRRPRLRRRARPRPAGTYAGRLSPQLCFVEGDRDAATAFALPGRRELVLLAETLPPARLELGDRLAIRRLRDESEWALMFYGDRHHPQRAPEGEGRSAGRGSTTTVPAASSRLPRTPRRSPSNLAHSDSSRSGGWRGVAESLGRRQRSARRASSAATREAKAVAASRSPSTKHSCGERQPRWSQRAVSRASACGGGGSSAARR